MVLRHIRFFLALAEEEHVNRAARRLGMAQPPLSRRLRELERELGYQLFERLPRGVRLTDAGRSLYADTKPLVEQLDRALIRAKGVASGLAGTLRVGLNSIAARYPLVPRSCQRFRECYPDVDLKLTLGMSQTQFEALQAGTIDAGFLYELSLPADGFVHVPVMTDDVVLVMPRGHRLAARAVLHLADLKDEGFVRLRRSRGTVFHDRLLAGCQEGGLEPRFVQDADDGDTVLSLVSVGMGLAFVSATAHRNWSDALVFKPVADLSLPMRLMLAWRQHDRSPVLERFVTTVEAAIAA